MENSFISKIFFIFGQWAIFLTASRKKVAELSKLDSQFQWKLSGESFCKTYRLLFFWISSGKISAGCPKKVSGACKLLSTSHWEQVEENIFRKVFASFVDIFLINSCIWAEKVWPVSQNCILRIYQIILRENWFGKEIKLFIIFRQWAGSFRLVVEFFNGEVRTAFYVSKITF